MAIGATTETTPTGCGGARVTGGVGGSTGSFSVGGAGRGGRLNGTVAGPVVRATASADGRSCTGIAATRWAAPRRSTDPGRTGVGARTWCAVEPRAVARATVGHGDPTVAVQGQLGVAGRDGGAPQPGERRASPDGDPPDPQLGLLAGLEAAGHAQGGEGRAPGRRVAGRFGGEGDRRAGGDGGPIEPAVGGPDDAVDRERAVCVRRVEGAHQVGDGGVRVVDHHLELVHHRAVVEGDQHEGPRVYPIRARFDLGRSLLLGPASPIGFFVALLRVAPAQPYPGSNGR